MGNVFRTIGKGFNKFITNPAVKEGFIAGVVFEVVTTGFEEVKNLVDKEIRRRKRRYGMRNQDSDSVSQVFDKKETEENK